MVPLTSISEDFRIDPHWPAMQSNSGGASRIGILAFSTREEEYCKGALGLAIYRARPRRWRKKAAFEEACTARFYLHRSPQKRDDMALSATRLASGLLD